MSKLLRYATLTACVIAMTVMHSTAQPADGQTVPQAKVTMHSSTAAVAPGQTFEVALKFQLPDGWHIYWKNPGAAGLAPAISWKLPDGYTASPLKYPVPMSHVTGDLVTNILEGEPILVAEVTAPDGVPASQSVAIGADINFQMCKDLCVLQKASVSLELPTAEAGAEIKETEEDLFASARRAMPKSTSRYVRATLAAKAESLSPGQSLDLILKLAISKGNHIQSNKPENPNFVATELFIEKTPGIEFGSPIFPKAKSRQIQYVGRVSEFAGTIDVKIPATVAEDSTSKAARIAGVVTYQVCNDQGTCYAPETIKFETIVGDPNQLPQETAVSTETTAEPSAQAETPSAPTSKSSTPSAQTASESPQSADANAAGTAERSFIWMLCLAFLGGLILNVMPCVLPVISIKILSFVQQADEDPRRIFKMGLVFAAGIIVSFEVLAIIVIMLKQADEAVGWGFQLQSPSVVIVLTSVIFVFGLSLFGVFEITLPGATMSRISTAEQKEGYLGAFLKGVLATALSTPCLAPFMGPAIAYAVTREMTEIVSVFGMVGIGMSLPYVILTAFPQWLKFLPKPGAWMETFKQFMGFVLMGTVIFLLITVGAQLGADGVVWTVAFLAFLGLAVWTLGKQTPSTTLGGRLGLWLAALIVAGAGWFVCYGHWFTMDKAIRAQKKIKAAVDFHAKAEADGDPTFLRQLDYSEGIPWQPWWEDRPQDLARQGFTVFVDYTATWCATCHANKKNTFEVDEVRALLDEYNVVPLKGDFTQRDKDILEVLTKYERSGVPLNLIYPAYKPDDPIVLPVTLIGRIEFFMDQIKQAGPTAP